ncbi:NAD-dependent dehydratase [Rhodoplanes elegans]|uniref:UDP-glucuronate decarboxylase n=1 Tax=Rhodoplanes elegans TaxID=29408 RepID=A0A327KRH3_9BRAD|nr:UDP-glucuronic acid decarboxylase family protein [Rhodoplanes elegans]MBK5957700.1 NAD-dependent dehydratase [Rhodoplanes elegans]RAI41540.1 NAD-dependent dehydratase [Rhodoplanes elegans]
MPPSGSLNIVVTGGAGFIGSHLCDRLVHKGHAVTCVDNLYTGRFDNVRPLSNHRNFRFVKADVREPLAIEGPVDRIYNLACPASPPHYQRDPIGTVKTCVLGAIHALELARTTGARILQASTSEVYGDPDIHPQPESYRGAVNPVGPRACYDEGKRCAEALFFDYRRVHGVSVKVARIFNTYGPRMLENDGRVISNFVVQALRNQPITLYGDGSQTRSFCYVEDLLDGLELLMESDDTVTGPLNLGNPREVTVKEIADMVLAQTGSRSRLAYHPLPQDDPRRRKPEITAAASALGWQPRIALEDGLRSTIDYFALKVATPTATAKHADSNAVIDVTARPSRKRRTALSTVGGSA